MSRSAIAELCVPLSLTPPVRPPRGKRQLPGGTGDVRCSIVLHAHHFAALEHVRRVLKISRSDLVRRMIDAVRAGKD